MTATLETDSQTNTADQTLAGTYTIDPTHSRIGFVARHAMVTKVRGSFDEFSGIGYFDPENPSATAIDLTIQAASIDTRNADRDGHLKSNDFFDMENYPTLTFVATSTERVGASDYRVTGDLTIRGVTKSVTVDFEYQGAATDPFGNHRIGFEGSAVVSRKDYGMSFNAALETGGVLVSDKITLELEVSAIRQDS
jgi:polyisoprenoid-binding protein YceI